MIEGQERDNCQVCKGAKGGVRGNENRINGVVICDYCTVIWMDATNAGHVSPGNDGWTGKKCPEPDCDDGQVETELGFRSCGGCGGTGEEFILALDLRYHG